MTGRGNEGGREREREVGGGGGDTKRQINIQRTGRDKDRLTETDRDQRKNCTTDDEKKAQRASKR